MPPRTLVLLVFAALALSGCGRRGALEAPGEKHRTPAVVTSSRTVPVPAAPDSTTGIEVTSTEVGANVMLDPSSPGAQEPEVTRRNVPLPQRRFILDPLL
jgi:predicted small lipoprotein YifL